MGEAKKQLAEEPQLEPGPSQAHGRKKKYWYRLIPVEEIANTLSWSRKEEFDDVIQLVPAPAGTLGVPIGNDVPAYPITDSDANFNIPICTVWTFLVPLFPNL